MNNRYYIFWFTINLIPVSLLYKWEHDISYKNNRMTISKMREMLYYTFGKWPLYAKPKTTFTTLKCCYIKTLSKIL